MTVRKRMKLGEILLDAGLIDAAQLEHALQYQRRHTGCRFGATLVRLGFLSEEVLLNFLSGHLRLPRIELAHRTIPENMLTYIPADKAWEFRAVPVDLQEMHGTIYLLVAMADPTNLDVIDALQFMTGCRVRAAVASDSAIEAALERCYGPHPEAPARVEADGAEAAATAEAAPLLPPSRSPVETPEERIQELLKILLDKGILTLREYDRLR